MSSLGLTCPKLNIPSSPSTFPSTTRLPNGCHRYQQGEYYCGNLKRGSCVRRVDALPDWPLMAVMVQEIQQLDATKVFITNKSVTHLSDQAIKNVYAFYIMFTCWGCMFFGSTKDPYYDSEAYREEGGDGTGHWIYEKQEDMEQQARAELWREELIEEIEQKGGGLRELEEAGRK